MPITKAIIPVAGLGTRFLPATKTIPKEMLPVVDKPVIQYIVEEAVASGITDIIFITSASKKSLEDYFDANFELEERLKAKGESKKKFLIALQKITRLARFYFIRQNEPKGDGDAVLYAKELVKNEPFAVLFGDDVVISQKPCLKQLIEVYEKYQAPVAALEEVPLADVDKYGIITGELAEADVYKIAQIVEKPKPSDAPSRLSIVGKYILTPAVLDIMSQLAPDDGEIRFSYALRDSAKKFPVYGYKFQGTRYDCGSVAGWLKANRDLGQNYLK